MPDVLVTGLPRSGLTRVAALVDGLPSSICLNNPLSHVEHVRQAEDLLSYAKLLVGEFVWTRNQLIHKSPINDFRAVDGTPLVDELYDPKAAKNAVGEPRPITFTRPKLMGDFILAAKHHTLYTSVLPTLTQFNHFKVIAVIRNPLDIFALWQQLPQPLLVKGKPSGIARFWPEALAVASSSGDIPTCYAQLYDLYLQRYHELREHIHIIKYEDAMNEPVVISRLFGTQSRSTSIPLIQAYQPPQRTLTDPKPFQEAIKKYGVYTKIYYKNI